jgi:nogalonic acid methyl ester cyclase / aklanonic acid methyl ester cyclase
LADERRLIERGFSAIESGDTDEVEEYIHPDFINHVAGPENPQGPAGFAETIRWLHETFRPKIEIEDTIFAGDRIAARRRRFEATGLPQLP